MLSLKSWSGGPRVSSWQGSGCWPGGQPSAKLTPCTVKETGDSAVEMKTEQKHENKSRKKTRTRLRFKAHLSAKRGVCRRPLPPVPERSILRKTGVTAESRWSHGYAAAAEKVSVVRKLRQGCWIFHCPRLLSECVLAAPLARGSALEPCVSVYDSQIRAFPALEAALTSKHV